MEAVLIIEATANWPAVESTAPRELIVTPESAAKVTVPAPVCSNVTVDPIGRLAVVSEGTVTVIAAALSS